MSGQSVDCFASARAKFDRGKEHVEAVNSEVVAFGDAKAYRFFTDHNADFTEWALRLRILQEPPLIRWSLMAGDAVHNLRCALDHAIYGIVRFQTGQDPPPNHDVLAFPICDAPRSFPGSLSALGPFSRDKELRAVVDRLQPYKRGDGSEIPALTLLRDLDNADKHRLIQLATVQLHHAGIGFGGIPPGSEVTHTFNDLPLVDGAPLIETAISQPAPKMHMQPGTMIVMPAIHHAPTPKGTTFSGVTWVLDHVRDEVEYALAELAPYATTKRLPAPR